MITFLLSVAAVVLSAPNGNMLRGFQRNLDDLKERAQNPTLRDKVRGNTVRQLLGTDIEGLSKRKGVVKGAEERQRSLLEQSTGASPTVEGRVVKFFSVSTYRYFVRVYGDGVVPDSFRLNHSLRYQRSTTNSVHP